MKWLKGLKYVGFLALAGVLITQCTPPPPAPAPDPRKGDDYYDRKNRDDKDRNSVLDRSKKRYSGPKCEGDDDCEEICKDIYNRRSVREDCLELAAEQVEKLWEIYEAFENPGEDELASIDAVDFETFIEIDLRPVDTLIGKLSASEAKRVLAWIGEEPDIAKVFQDEDDDYRLLKELLRNINSDLKKALSKNIIGSDSFMEIAIDSNEDALNWIHSFFSEECSNDAAGEEVCIFNDWYCEVDLDEDEWDFLIGDEEGFEQVLNEILEDYTIPSGAPSWWAQAKADEDEAKDLTAEQVEELCGKTFEEET